jgi:FkbM family methyltransferase
MIETLATGIKVIRDDSHISQWVKDAGGLPRLHGDASLQIAVQNIHLGDHVVDVGCNIGIHSRFYAQVVGRDGRVIGFDPNPDAIECARSNCPRGEFHNVALGAKPGRARLHILDNVGASFLESASDATDSCEIARLDDFALERIDFIKIDAEGSEIAVLEGARETIARFRPKMVIEVNDGALARQGHRAADLLTTIEALGYSWQIVPSGLKPTDPQFDVLCLPL